MRVFKTEMTVASGRSPVIAFFPFFLLPLFYSLLMESVFLFLVMYAFFTTKRPLSMTKIVDLSKGIYNSLALIMHLEHYTARNIIYRVVTYVFTVI